MKEKKRKRRKCRRKKKDIPPHPHRSLLSVPLSDKPLLNHR